jgi:hypothetical protein
LTKEIKKNKKLVREMMSIWQKKKLLTTTNDEHFNKMIKRTMKAHLLEKQAKP